MPSHTVERSVSIKHKEISFQIFQNKMRPFIFISTFCWMVYEHHCSLLWMSTGEGAANNKIKIHETRFERLKYLLTHHIPRSRTAIANVRRKHYIEALVLMVDSQIATKCSCFCLDIRESHYKLHISTIPLRHQHHSKRHNAQMTRIFATYPNACNFVAKP